MVHGFDSSPSLPSIHHEGGGWVGSTPRVRVRLGLGGATRGGAGEHSWAPHIHTPTTVGKKVAGKATYPVCNI